MAKLRSLLFVPADSERKLARAFSAGADLLILDLEDAVSAARKAAAREMAASFLRQKRPEGMRVFIRINPLGSGLALADLLAAGAAADGVVLPKACGGADIVTLGHYLDVLEAQAGRPEGGMHILPVATETPAALFGLASYAPAHPRLLGLTWGAEDLAACLGATGNRDASGWYPQFEAVRSQCLFAAAHAGVAAIDTLYADYKDLDGLRADCLRARRDGFAGRLAIHPGQVAVINEAFSPSAEEVAQAERVVAAFAAEPGAGVVGLDGKMLDLPHLKAAQATLARRGGFGGGVPLPRGGACRVCPEKAAAAPSGGRGLR